MRRFLVLVIAFVLGAVLPGAVLAARQWDLTATPLTLETGTSTAIRLTATNLSSSGSGITCVQVQVDPAFAISSVAVVSIKGQTSGAGYLAWTAVWPGGTTVAFKSALGTARLKQNDGAVFLITGTASAAGKVVWSGGASDKAGLPVSTSCPSSSYPATALQLTVTSPTPTPTPKPTPAPTAQPSATPSPTAVTTPGPGSTPAPTATAEPSATPAESPGASASPGFTSEPSTPAVAPPPSPGDGSQPPIAGGFEIGTARGQTGAIPVGGLDGVVTTALSGLPGGALAWGFPAFALTVPGLLLLLAVGAQALGALAWLPLVRRRLGGFGFRRRRDS